MQAFRGEPTLKDYYHADYKFADISETESIRATVVHSTSPTSWRERNSIDWSPNKARYRGQRRKHDKKKIEVPLVWTLPSS